MQLQNRAYTPEEYLQLEKQAEYKSEYRDGEIIPMTRHPEGRKPLLSKYGVSSNKI